MPFFSLILPEGGRSAIHKHETIAAFREARDCNRSRAARDLPAVQLLHRPTGQVIDVPPGADVLALATAWDAR